MGHLGSSRGLDCASSAGVDHRQLRHIDGGGIERAPGAIPIL
jgi:hypothetical protein